MFVRLMDSKVSVNGWLPGHLAFRPVVRQFIMMGRHSEVSERGRTEKEEEGRKEGKSERARGGRSELILQYPLTEQLLPNNVTSFH